MRVWERRPSKSQGPNTTSDKNRIWISHTKVLHQLSPLLSSLHTKWMRWKHGIEKRFLLSLSTLNEPVGFNLSLSLLSLPPPPPLPPISLFPRNNRFFPYASSLNVAAPLSSSCSPPTVFLEKAQQRICMYVCIYQMYLPKSLLTQITTAVGVK